jgi:hypothetical protein
MQTRIGCNTPERVGRRLSVKKVNAENEMEKCSANNSAVSASWSCRKDYEDINTCA